MSKGTGYSIRLLEHEQVLAAVKGAGAHLWDVEDLSTSSVGAPPPREYVRGIEKDPQRATWLIPNDLAQASVLPLPQLKGKELERAVLGWVGRQEKSPTENFSISWRALPRSKNDKDDAGLQVLALYAEHSEINAQIATPLAQELKPGRMLPPYMVLDQFTRSTLDFEDAEGCWNLVFLGSKENFLVVSRSDGPLITRALPFDLSEGSENQQYIQQLATEIDRSSFYVRQTAGSPEITKILVMGQADLAGQVAEELKNRVETTVKTWDLSQHFRWGDRQIEEDCYIPLMSAALSLEKTHFNLLPTPKRTLLGPKTRRRLMVAAGSAGVALLPVLLIGSTLTAKVQEEYLKKARDRLEIAKLEAHDAAEVYKQQRLRQSRQNYLESFATSQPDLEAVLVEIGHLAPSEIRFRDLRITEDDLGKVRLVLTGESGASTSGRAQEAFIEFQKALDQASFLQKYMEPMRLEIDSDASGNVDRPQTIFQLKYVLVTQDSQGEDAS